VDGLEPDGRQALEEALPAPGDRRRDDEPEYVDDAGGKERPSDRDAGVDADVVALLTLQVPHEIDQAAVDRARVCPVALERRRRCDVLGDCVDE
jgi:hypothetical protein